MRQHRFVYYRYDYLNFADLFATCVLCDIHVPLYKTEKVCEFCGLRHPQYRQTVSETCFINELACK